MTEKQIENIKKMVKIGLEYDVDQTYILEDIERVLNGETFDIIEPSIYY